jgi:hypothetical protein
MSLYMSRIYFHVLLKNTNILAANGIQVREIFFHIIGDLG